MIGRTLSHYQIEEKLGQGGMGVVYRAIDTRLNRPVAIKVLPPEAVADPGRKKRFTQEARAASALNHPNIITIHEIDSADGIDFMVMEYVPGKALDGIITSSGLSMDEALPYAIEIADALAAAHAAGIVHRDLKPGNIMVSENGRVKVLDFGLAKLIEPTEADELAATRTLQTAEGAILGTAAYMSPEQAEGKPVDGRSDIFSFGAVLYEIVTGRRPFQGETKMAVLSAILHRAPLLPSQARPNLPPEMERIILTALEKDRDLRFQTAAELRAALKRVQRDRDSGEHSATQVPGLRGRPWMVAPALAIALAAVGLTWHVSRRAPAPVWAEYEQITNFLDSVGSPALSPDGRILAFARGESNAVSGKGEIYVKMLPDGDPVALTHDGTMKAAPVFSPDGSRVAYTTTGWSTWTVPVLGGEPTQLLPNASGLTWIGPRRLLYSEIKSGLHMAIVTATESRTESRDVYVPPTAQGMAHFSHLSPDGRWVLLVEMDTNGWLPCRLVPFDGSTSGKSIGPLGAPCTAADWSPDGKWMYLSSGAGGAFHIWRQRFPDGVPEQITFGATEEEGIAVAPDGRSLITAIGTQQSAVWLHDASGDRQISGEGYAYRPSLAADGRVFYLVRRGVQRSFWTGELWAVDPASGRRERVLPDFAIRHYHLSADGKRVVFDAFDKGGKSRIWVASTGRAFPPRQLTPPDGPEEQRAFFGSSGDVFFLREETVNDSFIYRMKEDGSGRQRAVSEPLRWLVTISPDEKWAIVWTTLPGNTAGPAVFAFPMGGGSPVALCSCAMGQIRPESPLVSWPQDGKTILLGIAAMGAARTVALPLPSGGTLPSLPSSRMLLPTELDKLPGAQVIPEGSMAPGRDTGTYAFARTAGQRNLYRIRLEK